MCDRELIIYLVVHHKNYEISIFAWITQNLNPTFCKNEYHTAISLPAGSNGKMSYPVK